MTKIFIEWWSFPVIVICMTIILVSPLVVLTNGRPKDDLSEEFRSPSPFESGREAYRLNMSPEANPYKCLDMRLSEMWFNGYKYEAEFSK